MNDQAHYWSEVAPSYEQEFVDPYGAKVRNPLLPALEKLASREHTVADLGCGTGPLLPFLSRHFARVHAVDFAAGMLARAQERCAGLSNIAYHTSSLLELQNIPQPVDVAVAVNSLVMPDVGELQQTLSAIHRCLRPGGSFLGIVPSMDGVHYVTMLALEAARQGSVSSQRARNRAAKLAEHPLFDFAFGEFRYRGLVQHFWQPFEIPYRLRRAGFVRVRIHKVELDWEQFQTLRDVAEGQPPPWDWFFQADKPANRAQATSRSAEAR